MKRIIYGAFSCMSLLAISCTKYRSPSSPPAPAVFDSIIHTGSLRINEFICKGVNTDAQTYFHGSDGKWFELYNPGTLAVKLDPGAWFVTDSIGWPDKYAIPADAQGNPWIIGPGKFLAILCIKTGSIPCDDRINASFSLNSTSGDIGIFYKKSSLSTWVNVDSLHYDFPGGAQSGISYGRLPDGQGPLVQLTKVTPESPNQ